MQTKLNENIKELNLQITTQKTIIEEKENTIETIKKTQESLNLKKNDEKRELKQQIEEMSSNFTNVLKDILEKMK